MALLGEYRRGLGMCIPGAGIAASAFLMILVLVLPSTYGAAGSSFQFSFEFKKGIQLPDSLPMGLRGWQGLEVGAYSTVTHSDSLSTSVSIGGLLSGQFAGRRTTGMLDGNLEMIHDGMDWKIQGGSISGDLRLTLPTPLYADISLPAIGKMKITVQLILGGSFSVELGPDGSVEGGSLSLTAGVRAEGRANIRLFVLSFDLSLYGEITATLSGGYDDAWWVGLDIGGEIGASASIGSWTASFSLLFDWSTGTRGNSEDFDGEWVQTHPWHPISYLPTSSPHSSEISVLEDNDVEEFSPDFAPIDEESSLLVWSRRSDSLPSGSALHYSVLSERGATAPRPVTSSQGEMISPSLTESELSGAYLSYLRQPISNIPTDFGSTLPERRIEIKTFDGTDWENIGTSSIPSGSYANVDIAEARNGDVLLVFNQDLDSLSETSADSRIGYIPLWNGNPRDVVLLDDQGTGYEPTVAPLGDERFLVVYTRDSDGLQSTSLDRDLMYSVVTNGMASVPRLVLSDAVEQREPHLAAAPSGIVGLVFIESAGPGQIEVVRYTEFDGDTWKPAQSISSPGYLPHGPSLTYSEDGSALAAWIEGGNPFGEALVALKEQDSKAWFPPVSIPDVGFEAGDIVATPTSDGFLSAWTSSSPTPEGEWSEQDMAYTQVTGHALKPTIPEPPLAENLSTESSPSREKGPPTWFPPVVVAWSLSLMTISVIVVLQNRKWRKKNE